MLKYRPHIYLLFFYFSLSLANWILSVIQKHSVKEDIPKRYKVINSQKQLQNILFSSRKKKISSIQNCQDIFALQKFKPSQVCLSQQCLSDLLLKVVHTGYHSVTPVLWACSEGMVPNLHPDSPGWIVMSNRYLPHHGLGEAELQRVC